jgi:anti-anti-sigma factor
MVTQRTRLLETEVWENGVRVVVCDTDLDATKGQALAEYLLALAGRLPGGKFEVDLGHVRGLCSSCLGKLIGLDRRLRANGGHLTLLGVRGEVSEVFRLTHLNGVLDIHEAV